LFLIYFFNHTATPTIYTLSLHDALPIFLNTQTASFNSATNFTVGSAPTAIVTGDFNNDGKLDLAVVNKGSNNVSILLGNGAGSLDRKSTRLNSSHSQISYAVFCLKKKI